MLTAKEFLQDFQRDNAIIQVGMFNKIECINIEEVNSYVEKNKDKDIYFLADVKPELQYSRAKDSDMLEKSYVYFDFDIRKENENISDDEIVQKSLEAMEKLKTSKFALWSHFVFTGNGIHIYFTGTPTRVKRMPYSIGYEVVKDEISKIIGIEADSSCKNLARIARLPGSYNNKSEVKKVEVICKQDERYNMVQECMEKGEKKQKMDSLKSEVEKEVKREIQIQNGNKVYEEISKISVVDELLDFFSDWKLEPNGKNFLTPTGNLSAAYLSSQYENTLICDESREFAGLNKKSVSTFALVKHLYQLDDKQTFEYFKNKYTHINNLSEQEKEEWVSKNKNDNKKEKQIKFVQWNELLRRGEEETKKADPKDIFSYGCDFLDEHLGGMFAGELVLVGGITNTGKTTFAIKTAEALASMGKKVVVLALEERIETRAKKATCYEINRVRRLNHQKQINIKDFLIGADKGTQEERDHAISNIQTDNIEYISCDESITVDEIEKIYERGADFYVFDHLHYFDIEKGDDSKADAIQAAMKKINQLNIKYNSRTMLIAHFQKLDESKRPTMTNFKDSIAIAQTAHTIIMLWRDKSTDVPDEMVQYKTEFIIPKNRIGQPAVTLEAEFDINTNTYKSQACKKMGTMNSDIKQTSKLYNEAKTVFGDSYKNII